MKAHQTTARSSSRFDARDTGEGLERVGTWEAAAEADEEARQAVRQLNLHSPAHVRAFDDVA